MTTLATEDFAGTGSLSAAWAVAGTGTGVWDRSSGLGRFTQGTAPGTGVVRRVDVSFPNDQWAQVTIKATVSTVSDTGDGPIVRSSSGDDCILLQCNTVQSRVYKQVAATFTQIGSDGPAFADGDLAYVEVQGTTIIAKKNGASICGSPIALGTGPATGAAGLWGGGVAGVGTTNFLDDFSAGDFLSGLRQNGKSIYIMP